MVYKTENNNYYKIINEIYDNIISKNYDLSILNLYNDEFINEFKSFIINKPNFLILNELLNNFQNNRIIKPYNYDYLSGVACVYRLQKNDMTIYLFGESHSHRDACNNSNTNVNTKVEDFLEEVINKSSVFIDFYIELPIHYIKTALPEHSDHNLYKINNKFKNSNIARIHHIDIRQANLYSTLYTDFDRFLGITGQIHLMNINKMLNDYTNNYYLILIGYFLSNKLNLELISKISQGVITSYGDIYDFLTENININPLVKEAFYKKGLLRSNFKNKQKFISDFKNIFLSNLEDDNVIPFEEYSIWIVDAWNFYMKNKSIMPMDDFLSIMTKKFYKTNILSGISTLSKCIMDLYTLSRIFKDFNMKNKSLSTEPQIPTTESEISTTPSISITPSTPPTPKNVIVYAGSKHIENYLAYLVNYENFEIVEMIDQYKDCVNNVNNLNIDDILKYTQSMTQIIKFLQIITETLDNPIFVNTYYIKGFQELNNLIYDNFGKIDIENPPKFLDDFLNQDNIKTLIINYIKSLDINMRNKLIQLICNNKNTNCLDIRTLRQPLFTD
jgi:hypothetical protein